MKVLIADDEKNLRQVLRTELAEAGYAAEETDNGLEALKMLEKDEYDVLLLDINMPGLGGMEVLQKIRDAEIPTEVIILTGHGTISSAVEAMKLGAYDYITKPFKIEQLSAIMEKAHEKKAIIRENMALRMQLKRQEGARNLITCSALMDDVIENSRKVATSDLAVLITGESGVGKELVARKIHSMSQRHNGPFIPVNCGAITETMLESELFGHEKGAFTGAASRKPGLMEIADRGVLFLDEIGELSSQLQVKLLRAVESGAFFRVGGTREIQVDVKFVSATNKDLRQEVSEGRFRQDLYYRIAALTIAVPSLRERREDIPLLIEHFSRRLPEFREKKFSQDAIEALAAYPWPGNVRELQNVVHRVLLLSKNSVIGKDDLPEDILHHGIRHGKSLEDMEKEHILKVLRDAGGQRGKAAEILQIDPKTLYRKLQKYGFDD